MRWSISLLLFAAATAFAGPTEFGRAQLDAAIAARHLKFTIKTEVSVDVPPETFRIIPTGVSYARISGGDLRGLMYGLLEAAEQIELTGHLKETKSAPATPMRGIRIFLHNADLEKAWYYSEDFWRDYFAMLAKNRFNRFNLVFAHQTEYLAPPYPFLVDIPEFPQIQARGLSKEQRDRNLHMLRFISQTAADYAIDFTLGIWEQNIQRGMTPSVDGLTRENIGPYSHAALVALLRACPWIRSVQMRTNSESGIPSDQQVEFYRDYVFKALHEAGRRVTLDLRGWLMQPGLLQAAENAGVPLRLSSKYWCEDMGRPYQPAETFPNYSYINFLEKPGGKTRPYDFYWEIWALGSHRMLLWGDPDFVRRAVPTFTLSGSIGFEIDPPLAQKGFGNAPGTWSIPHEGKWEFEKYWLFYQFWGRLSYDPKAKLPPIANLDEYRAASQIISEIVAANLADPNMYVWPEINPGGIIDAYIHVPPSDPRMIASIPEAVRNRLDRVASAKQTPLDTAALLDGAAAKLDKTATLDFKILAQLARYHAHKQRAAYNLELFYQASDEPSLDRAESELRSALAEWEAIVKITEGVYPPNMAFGPEDTGHWRDKLPYVRHDLETIVQRRKVLKEFGHFEWGFDFGGATEPRFKPVTAATKYNDATGYGWLSDDLRVDVSSAPTPRLELRSVEKNPSRLPGDTLRDGSIRGHGSQEFRIKGAVPNSKYAAQFISSGGTTASEVWSSPSGVLDIRFPESDWEITALTIRSQAERNVEQNASIPALPQPLPRPQITHTPPAAAISDQPLTLTLHLTTAKDATRVRLHYRPLNALDKFKTIEVPAATSVNFTIPAADVPANFDLLYYFEIMNRENSGWFEPDPRVATPYFVVATSPH